MYPHGILGFEPALLALAERYDAYPSSLLRLRSDSMSCTLANVVEGQQQTFPLLRYLGLVEVHRSPNCEGKCQAKELE